MGNNDYKEDVKVIRESLKDIPVNWDGKSSIKELKSKDFQWRQMEWMGFYFEYLCEKYLATKGFKIPGEKYGKVEFDSIRNINWDMKSSAIQSNNHTCILNDQVAFDKSIEKYGSHGIILAMLDVEYNDENRSFQKWHSKLKGGLSEYERKRIERNAASRYRKTKAKVIQILLLVITDSNKEYLGTYKQGRNSNDKSRNFKYMLNIKKSDHFEVGRIDFENLDEH